jgi:hypothetical protein
MKIEHQRFTALHFDYDKSAQRFTATATQCFFPEDVIIDIIELVNPKTGGSMVFNYTSETSQDNKAIAWNYLSQTGFTLTIFNL